MMSEAMELECPDGVKRTFRITGQDYSQDCGGWLDPETGQIYAIANWGSERYWKEKRYYTYVHIGLTEDGKPVGTRSKSQHLQHGYDEQMNWWFAKNDIDVNKLEAITFTWRGRVGPSYNIVEGPMEGKHVSESLPAVIPREMMYGINMDDTRNLGNIGDANSGNVISEDYQIPLVQFQYTENVEEAKENVGLGDLLS